MKTSPEVKNIMLAIKNVQQNAGTVTKNAKGQVGSREYAYTNLTGTWDVIRDLLNTNDLVVISSPSTGDSNMGQFFQTTIHHTKSGEWISEQMMMVLQREDPQAIGAAITYYRRYQLTSMLGLIPDDDNDAKAHRLATAEQKARLVGAMKAIEPDLKSADLVQAIMNITGKHPSNIREDEAEKMVDLIKAFK